MHQFDLHTDNVQQMTKSEGKVGDNENRHTHRIIFFLTLAHYFRIAWFVYLLSSDEPKINVPIFKISQP